MSNVVTVAAAMPTRWVFLIGCISYRFIYSRILWFITKCFDANRNVLFIIMLTQTLAYAHNLEHVIVWTHPRTHFITAAPAISIYVSNPGCVFKSTAVPAERTHSNRHPRNPHCINMFLGGPRMVFGLCVLVLALVSPVRPQSAHFCGSMLVEALEIVCDLRFPDLKSSVNGKRFARPFLARHNSR